MKAWVLPALMSVALGCSQADTAGAPSPDLMPDLGPAFMPDLGPPPAACATATAPCRAALIVGSDKVIPYYRTFDISAPNPAITRAILVVHGDSRDVSSYFETMAAAAKSEGLDATTEVIAPYFQTDPSTVCGSQMDQPGPAELYWSCGGWKDGASALNDASVYSFSAMDALVRALAKPFPNLTQIVVAGFSAGGQFAQRYAASNQLEPTLSVPLRYVVGSPSSYVYLDGKRLTAAATCSDQNSCALDASSFVKPFFDSANCAGYDNYKYGLQNLSGYAAKIPTADSARQYAQRRVSYLLAALDSGPTTAAGYSELDVSCQADAQGPLQGTSPDRHSFRLQRGLTFHAYMASVFAAGHELAVVPACGHSQKCVFSSATGRSVVFH